MPFIDEDAFAKALKGEITENIFLFSGDDDYLKEHYCNLLTKKNG